MRTRPFVKRTVAIGLAVLAILALAWTGSGGAPATQDGNRVITLAPPSFLLTANAEGEAVESFLEDEAGISVYFTAPATIDLSLARKKYRTIEVETADYIIGSVPVGNNPESEDVHVYTHRNGWMVAYYLAPEAAAKIIDWRLYHDSTKTKFTTKLENGLAAVANEAGILYSNGTYYDFRHPNANRLMLIGEYGDGGSFQVYLPGTLNWTDPESERSWSLAGEDTTTFKLDGNTIISVNVNEWGSRSGTLSVAQLLPDQYHTVQVETGWTHVYGGLALVYRVP
jgi:hypothetical protein